ncbi:MAG TPA: hypothetical protein VMV72_18485 [Verrucomicrobiae bacterium]|nr:hypothetical protein [Verrucomicrobiae bacterium]
MAEAPDDIATLREAIRKGFKCESRHVESVPVREVFRRKSVWEGTVEVFDLVGHPKAKRAYAWRRARRDTGEEVRLAVLLGVPPIDSPQKAVHAVIMSDFKCGRK